MSRHVVVKPNSYRQFADPAETFCLIIDAELVDDYVVVDEGGSDGLAANRRYEKMIVVPVQPEDDLGDALAGAPDSADILAICRLSFLSSPDAEAIGADRRLVVMPCASTPVTRDHIRYFLSVMERTDPAAQASWAERFFTAVETAAPDPLRLVDETEGTVCTFDPFAGDYVWNQQAGPLEPGEQQIAPGGELSVLPMEITDFDPGQRLAMTGSLTLHGVPIVHAGYDPALAAPQAGLYERLVPLTRHPVVVDIDEGTITGCRPGAGNDPEAVAVATELETLFDREPRYRTIWELGFGINTQMDTVGANCGLNEPYGGTDGVVHIGLGLTPYTEFALTFLCPRTALTDAADTALLGRATRPGARPIRRVNRVRSASCGCH